VIHLVIIIISLFSAINVLISVRENVCNISKNVKSNVFWIFKKSIKNVKNVTT